MTDTKAKTITVGKVGSSFGVHGWLKIHTYTEFGPTILEYQPWLIQRPNGQIEPLALEDSKRHGDNILIKVKGIDSPEAAKLLTNQLILIYRDQLPILDENDYYWSDLIGLTVINQAGITLGKVIYLMETGANDVLVVKGEREHAIPYLPGNTIKHIDLNKKEMQVDWEPL
jgi:16S rRNA processing protein RimM